MASGALPATGKQLLHFETWLARRPAQPGPDPHGKLPRQFATWNLLPRLRATVVSDPGIWLQKHRAAMLACSRRNPPPQPGQVIHHVLLRVADR
jgi:hypothetical protein